MSTQHSEPAGLANLPCQIHLEIFSYLCPMGGTRGLVTTCKSLYNNLIIEFYKESGPQLNWLPLLVGISQGNIDILDKCRQAGASLNHRWPYLGEFGRASDPNLFLCCQPLDLATWYGQDNALKWLTEKRAVATDVDRPQFIEGKTTNHFVSDAATAEGRWKPVMYQQEAVSQETYPYIPHPHFVWYSHELKHTDILPRLLRLYSIHYGNCVECDKFDEYIDLIDAESAILLCTWIIWIGLDMLLCASDPTTILESAFAEEFYIGCLRIEKADSVADLFRLEFSADMFEPKSLLTSVTPLSVHPFPKHLSLRAPEAFGHLLDLGAEGDFVSQVYFLVLIYLMRFESSRLDIFPTFELYPILTDALIKRDASTYEDRFYVLENIHGTLQNRNDWKTNLTKMVLKAHDSGVSLSDVANAFGIRDEFHFSSREEIDIESLLPVSQAVLPILQAIRDGKL
ncbi:uncharacterized protein NECHADRAFT_74038 [Fusarium vanettenii 77-13-4]|uniref:F-box domain-containing protein n=1 Tax=Fusarium vanettenii (strain ATCC MYA-4622 / CBS 123669 / FGSC 9596 / NRRL 45880 / 77-13-4) TaxID=660122 RepID=C7YVQ2_FUSV7|nr:uncharacterized protein NECHADRAFT_74038 [Fusarium vanettenii 77-13-4]EEU43831.1 predicted protein [Fusarium vanettenii 77-13-4]